MRFNCNDEFLRIVSGFAGVPVEDIAKGGISVSGKEMRIVARKKSDDEIVDHVMIEE